MAKRLLLFLASLLISVFMIGCSANTDAQPVSKGKPSVETTAKTQQQADGDKKENAKKEKPIETPTTKVASPTPYGLTGGILE